MKAELQNKLFEKYPKIFAQKDLPATQTAMCWGITCGDGWYDIIDTLCETIQNRIDEPEKLIEEKSDFMNSALEDHDNDRANYWAKEIKRQESRIIKQIEAVQVKEKFGKLCFYVNDYSCEEINYYIRFAQGLTEKICEVCGNPGSKENYNGPWIKTVCKEHSEKIYE